MARDRPEAARALVALHRRYRESSEQVAALTSGDSPATLPALEAHDEVRDFFLAHHDHFAALDDEAERTVRERGLESARAAGTVLRELFTDGYGVKVVRSSTEREQTPAVSTPPAGRSSSPRT